MVKERGCDEQRPESRADYEGSSPNISKETEWLTPCSLGQSDVFISMVFPLLCSHPSLEREFSVQRLQNIIELSPQMNPKR